MRRSFGVLIGLCLLLFHQTDFAWSEEALHRRVDKLIEASADGVRFAPVASDAEFLRRVYLDLAGRIPTVDETKSFLTSAAPDKRNELIDALLAGADYPRRMQELFHAMLMERRGDHDEWTKFLRTAFENNTPWHVMARSIIHPDDSDESTRGAAYFHTARLVSEGAMAAVDVPGLTRDVGRLLVGVDLACAQCHDHVTIDDYLQVDFQGLHMVFENVQTRRDVQFPAVGEKLMTQEKEFMSVFAQVPTTTAPRVPGGGEIDIVTFAKGEEYVTPPDRKKRTPGVPKFSPLQELSQKLASPDNKLFCRNIVNRLWFVMMGRGLVEPLDLHHSANPPTHPELLDLLATEFAQHGFDIKWLLHELAQTKCYQRSSLVTDGSTPQWSTYAVAHEKRLSPEQIFWSTLIATRRLDTNVDLNKAVKESEELSNLQTLMVQTFANSPKEPEVEFEPTVKGALMLMHSEEMQLLTGLQDDNLTSRLLGLAEASDVADELFLSVFSRNPSEDDVADVEEYLRDKQGDDRAAALGQLVWALLASTEFCVNH